MSNQQHTPEPFVREPRYLVFKIKDTEKYLTQGEKDSLMSIDDEISCARADEGKPPFNAVVVEQDWPEFDLVWEMIEARMTGKGNDASRIVAAVNACAGKPTELLELAAEFDAADEDAAWEPPHPIFRMASDMDRLAEQRDELLAALYLALPFVEDHEGDSGYKPGAVSKAVSTIKAAIAAVEQPAYAPAAEGWIEWNGGECPVAECVLVNVKFANGEEQDALVPAGEWDWSHGNCGGYDIIAYRVVQEGSS